MAVSTSVSVTVVGDDWVVLNAGVQGLSVDRVFGDDWGGDWCLVRGGVLFGGGEKEIRLVHTKWMGSLRFELFNYN